MQNKSQNASAIKSKQHQQSQKEAMEGNTGSNSTFNTNMNAVEEIKHMGDWHSWKEDDSSKFFKPQAYLIS